MLRLTANTGDSSVGRASDCRMVQTSDGPWFDSGSPDICSRCLRIRALRPGRQAGSWHGVTVQWGGGECCGSRRAARSARHALRYDVRGLLCGLRDSNMVCGRQLSCRASHYVRTHTMPTRNSVPSNEDPLGRLGKARKQLYRHGAKIVPAASVV